MSVAKELILLAKQSSADYAKFQKRNPKALLSTEQYEAPHKVPYNAFGSSYGAHREFLELNLEQHRELKQYCEELNIGYACSVWDLDSAREIISLNPDYIKLPSACNNNIALMESLRDNYSGDIHISLGMTSKDEEKVILDLFKGHESRITLYACTSGYPVAFDDVCLLELNRIKEQHKSLFQNLGFSGHHLGIAVDIAAYTLGAVWIERHFTKDRTWKGTDHAASLEPSGLAKLIRNLNATHKSLSFKSEDILDVEKEQRDKLKFRS